MAGRRFGFLFTVVLGLAASGWLEPAFAASASAEAKFLLLSTAQQAFQEEAFERLEKQARAYRDNDHRLPDGGSALSSFYESFYSHPRAGAESNPRLAVSSKWVKRFSKSPTPYIVHAIQHLNTYHGLMQLVRVSEGAGLLDDIDKYKKSAAKHLADARKLLVKNQKIASKDPYYYAMLVTVASLQNASATDIQSILDDGLEHTPKSPAFHGAAIIAVSRTWPGDKARIAAFVEKVLDRVDQPDREMTYTNLYWSLSSFHGVDRIFKDWNVDWARFSVGLADILTRYPDDENGSWYARFACLAGDQKKTHELWSMAQNFPSPEIWSRPDIFYGCEMLAQSTLDRVTVPADGDLPGGL